MLQSYVDIREYPLKSLVIIIACMVLQDSAITTLTATYSVYAAQLVIVYVHYGDGVHLLAGNNTIYGYIRCAIPSVLIVC